MAPVFFDLLNIVETMHDHYRSLGGYTYAFFDYYYAGITEYLDSEAVKESLKVMDVITFVDRYTKYQQNYIICAANDQFFLLGNAQKFYKLVSEKTLYRFIPNQGHGGVAGSLTVPELCYLNHF